MGLCHKFDIGHLLKTNMIRKLMSLYKRRLGWRSPMEILSLVAELAEVDFCGSWQLLWVIRGEALSDRGHKIWSGCAKISWKIPEVRESSSRKIPSRSRSVVTTKLTWLRIIRILSSISIGSSSLVTLSR